MARKKTKQAPKIKEPVTTRGGKITQAILKKYLLNKKKLQKAKALKTSLRSILLPLLSAKKVDVEDGPITVVVKVVEKSSVDWRAEYVKLKGEKSAHRLECKNKKTERHLIVE